MRRDSVESVKDGLAKLIREVRLLQRESANLTATLRGFTIDRLEHRWSMLPPEANPERNPRAMPATSDPRSAIQENLYEYGNNPNLEAPTRTLLAISKEIDGALRDIRAARNDIKAIADDSDLRDDFKDWQKQNRS